MQKIGLLLLAALFFIPNWYQKDVNASLPFNQKEKFNPRLSYINSIPRLELYTDSIAAATHIHAGTYEYAELLESVIAERFYHGFSHFTPGENWIAALSGKWIREDLACKVDPEDIVQQPNAACSQQALVMMAVLRKKGMNYRSVGFPHHYAMEVQVGEEWYFFDANMEPVISKEQRSLANWQHQNDRLKQFYDTNRFSDLDFKLGNGLTATTGRINEVPAQRARLFHTVTGLLSKISWLLPLLLLFFMPRLQTRRPFIRVARPAVYQPA